jgi:hypothetical protein
MLPFKTVSWVDSDGPLTIKSNLLSCVDVTDDFQSITSSSPLTPYLRKEVLGRNSELYCTFDVAKPILRKSPPIATMAGKPEDAQVGEKRQTKLDSPPAAKSRKKTTTESGEAKENVEQNDRKAKESQNGQVENGKSAVEPDGRDAEVPSNVLEKGIIYVRAVHYSKLRKTSQ